MKYALIINDVIKQIQPKFETGFILVPDETIAGQILSGGVYIDPPLAPKTPDELRREELDNYVLLNAISNNLLGDSTEFDKLNIKLNEIRDLFFPLIVTPIVP